MNVLYYISDNPEISGWIAGEIEKLLAAKKYPGLQGGFKAENAARLGLEAPGVLKDHLLGDKAPDALIIVLQGGETQADFYGRWLDGIDPQKVKLVAYVNRIQEGEREALIQAGFRHVMGDNDGEGPLLAYLAGENTGQDIRNEPLEFGSTSEGTGTTGGEDVPYITWGPLRFYRIVERVETTDGQSLYLTPRGHALLGMLIEKAGDLVEREQILTRLYSGERRATKKGTPLAMDIAAIRREISATCPNIDIQLKAMHGKGYCLYAPGLGPNILGPEKDLDCQVAELIETVQETEKILQTFLVTAREMASRKRDASVEAAKEGAGTTGGKDGPYITWGPLRFHRISRKVETTDGQSLHLTPRGHALLGMLVENAGDLVEREQILTRLYGGGSDRTRNSRLSRDSAEVCREISATCPDIDIHLKTIRGKGYCLYAPSLEFKTPGPEEAPDHQWAELIGMARAMLEPMKRQEEVLQTFLVAAHETASGKRDASVEATKEEAGTTGGKDGPYITWGPLRFHRISRTVETTDGKNIRLGSRGHALLGMLVENAGNLVEGEQILTRLYSNKRRATERTKLSRDIRAIRREISAACLDTDIQLKTILGEGYRLWAPSLEFKPPRPEGNPDHQWAGLIEMARAMLESMKQQGEILQTFLVAAHETASGKRGASVETANVHRTLLSYNEERDRFYYNGWPLTLGAMPRRLLVHLWKNPCKFFTRDDLQNRLGCSGMSIPQRIASIRRAFKEANSRKPCQNLPAALCAPRNLLVYYHGMGYSLRIPEASP